MSVQGRFCLVGGWRVGINFFLRISIPPSVPWPACRRVCHDGHAGSQLFHSNLQSHRLFIAVMTVCLLPLATWSSDGNLPSLLFLFFCFLLLSGQPWYNPYWLTELQTINQLTTVVESAGLLPPSTSLLGRSRPRVLVLYSKTIVMCDVAKPVFLDCLIQQNYCDVWCS